MIDPNDAARPNMVILRDDVYLVRTQAGFRKALKHRCKEDETSRKLLRGYPRFYPALVRFVWSEHPPALNCYDITYLATDLLPFMDELTGPRIQRHPVAVAGTVQNPTDSDEEST
jgi:hypothetical protein